MSEVILSQTEQDAIAVLADYLPEPGTRCPTCSRRVNKPRQSASPEARAIRAGKLPHERAEAVEEALDILQELVGGDEHSYPRGHLLEGLTLLGAQQREELRAYFTRYV